MNIDINERIGKWFMSLEDIDIGNNTTRPLGEIIEEVNTNLHQLADKLYVDYEPTRGAHPDFWRRLERWLDNVDDAGSQQVLFRLLPHLFFIGPREFDSLYRTAFNHQIATWLIDQLDLKLDDPQAGESLQRAIEATWFCPITDSMRINKFYHLNRIEGMDHRPDWRSLDRFGDKDKMSDYIKLHGIKRIVLLEDFVGNGSQIRKAVECAAQLSPELPVLVVPLVICPSADALITELQGKYCQLTFAPCLRLPEMEFLTATPTPGESILYPAVRIIAEGVADSMKIGLSVNRLAQAKKFIPYGWHGTGALVVLYTNCPNNTLPIIFHESQNWSALFPRASRV
jgi:hypothetical protein